MSKGVLKGNVISALADLIDNRPMAHYMFNKTNIVEVLAQYGRQLKVKTYIKKILQRWSEIPEEEKELPYRTPKVKVPKPAVYKGFVERKGPYDVQAVLAAVLFTDDTEPDHADFDGESIKMNSGRLQNFALHGITCKHCGVEGSFFMMDKYPKDERFHFNLYGYRPDGSMVMMTRDHIVPKCLGGADDQDNYQVLCEKCNKAKGGKPEEIAIVDAARRLENDRKMSEVRLLQEVV